MEQVLNAKTVREKGKRDAASSIFTELASQGRSPSLDVLIDDLLDLDKLIDDSEIIDWLRWLIAGGKSPTEYTSIGECYWP